MECTVEHTINKRKYPLTAKINIMENRPIKKASEILPITELLFCHKNIKISEFRSSSPSSHSENFLPPYIKLIAEFYINSLFFYFKSNIYWGMPFEFLRIISVIFIKASFSICANGTDVNRLSK
jgi:hypothetical protein